jgi:hypothetical protein
MPELAEPVANAEPPQGAQQAIAPASGEDEVVLPPIITAENVYDFVQEPAEEPWGGPFDPDDGINWKYWQSIGFGKWEVRTAAQSNGTQYGCASSALSVVTGKEPRQFMVKTDEEGVIQCLSVTDDLMLYFVDNTYEKDIEKK